MATVTKPTHEWADVVCELTWIGTDGDFRDEEERTSYDKADADRLVLLIEGQLPESYWDNEDQATVEIPDEELDRLQELVGIVQ